jgi:hypothetical protein
MTIYRTIGYVHACQPDCTACTQNYGPGPEEPGEYEECCRYVENGQRVVVLLQEQPLMLKPGGKRTRPGARKARIVVIKPKARAVKRPPVKTRSAKARRSLGGKSARGAKSR